MLSGIQHFRFCPRQWALIHLEQQWNDNRLTVEGKLLHKHVDDPFYRQKCGEHIILRAVNIASNELGLYGVSDAIELIPTEDKENSICHPRYTGHWIPIPIEYKHGKPKCNEVDEVQIVAQAMCIEEMYSIHVTFGKFYYAETRHQIEVDITPRLRDIVRECTNQMHEIFCSQRIPHASFGKHCYNCSLMNICMPETERCSPVNTYLIDNLYK